VAQIPALLISVAAAMVVSRVGKERTSAARSAARCSTRRARWAWHAGIVGLLGLVPGMPHLVFLADRPAASAGWPGC
jgi:flagellar biosynthesis protein FlhA